VPDALLDELFRWLRIPSISSGGGDPQDLVRAAEWVCERVREAGGTAEIVETAGNPLAVGELRASDGDAPTVLIYGHYDVQSANPVDLWTTPPFEPVVRDGRVYARGASDDKGNFLPLLHVACDLARRGALPVHVRVLAEGEEEVGGHHVLDWIAADERGADVAIVFDSSMADAETPAVTLGVRGMVQLAVEVEVGRRDLHSGVYGGSVLNAVHVMNGVLAAVLPGPDGRLRDELRAGIEPPAPEERESWQALEPGDKVIAAAGGRPVHPGAGAEYYERNWGDASLDVNGIAGGDAVQARTIVPARAQAILSMRLAAGQSSDAMFAVLEGLLVGAAPAGATVTVRRLGTGDPAAFDPSDPAIGLALGALERACGRPAALVRSGGSIAALSAFAERGIPTILSGFALNGDDIHAPNESFRLESLELGRRSALELYTALARLRNSA
jgi:acetylornithine deacetylase/succinyl-diaminopimelate desuccinylase-like protein